MSSPLSGVTADQVGNLYDFALGWDTGTTIQMVGYVCTPGSPFSDASDLTDDQRLVQVASPNSTDRYSYFPRVTQGDWSGGEGQMYYVDPTRYYQSWKVDVTKPGNLTLTPGASIATVTIPTTNENRAPTVSDGNNTLTGVAGASGAALLIKYDGTTMSVASMGEPKFGGLGPSGGAFFATPSGIWQVAPPIDIGSTVAQWTSDVVEPTATQAFAYMSSVSQPGIFYIKSDNTIRYIGSALGNNPNTNPSVVAGSAYPMEQPIRFLTSTATGLLFATQSPVAVGNATNPRRTCYLYSFDGATTTRIADLPGKIHAGYEMNGVTYLLAELQQLFSYNPQVTLLAYANGSLTILNDLRYALPDFQSKILFSYQGFELSGSLSGDGRFLYISWPGLYPLAYDTVRQAFFRVGPAALQPIRVTAHRGYMTSNGYADVVSTRSALPDAVTLTIGNANSDTGYVISSWMDFGATSIVKAFRAIDVALNAPLPAGSSVVVVYRLDNDTTDTATTPTTLANGNLRFLIPVTHSKGIRLRWTLTLNAATGGFSPSVREVALKAVTCRTYKATVSCRREQDARDGNPDSQGLASKDLIANLMNCYLTAAGACVLFIPDATATSGVSTVNATLQSVERDVQGAGAGYTAGEGGWDMEGDLSVVLVEEP